MANQAWKAFERWVCNVFGGERDWEHPEECRGTNIWAPEAKYRKKLPGWLTSMIIQAESQARDDQIPLVVLTEHHMQRRQALAIMRVGDLLDWFVSASAEAEDEETLEEEDTWTDSYQS
jgi:hypothetical protein